MEHSQRERGTPGHDQNPVSPGARVDALDPSRVVAPMTGRVLTVRAKPNDTVSAGDELCVLEAMKMEHSLVAAMDGKIKAVHVEEGQQVTSGQLLVEFETG